MSARLDANRQSAAAYGFAGWVLSFIAYVIFLAWAYLPEANLHKLGITYYPSKYWAIALPIWFCMAIMTTSFMYVAVNMLATAPLDSLETITDSHARKVEVQNPWSEEAAARRVGQVPAIGDLDMEVVNKLLYLRAELPRRKAHRRSRSDRC
uniref:PIG-P domain-containing protein n=1 Tax=Octactis speculum TaxID=3111310 RepID=A0A7S2D162_9STRA|mmetsp:Transcript_41456/g.56513  ORF Transcript_41456/g.56513 Transcript_41456/m.56513 type:complete len:152 (+) Transcript_41456:45-500(+)